MSDKQYLSAQGLLEDSWKLAEQILKSDFRPTFMIAVWRGGVPIGIAVQEYLSYHGIDTDNIAIRTSSYQGIDQQARQVAVHGLGYLVKNIQHSDSLLIVDDVFDSGRSIEAIVNELTRLARRNDGNNSAANDQCRFHDEPPNLGISPYGVYTKIGMIQVSLISSFHKNIILLRKLRYQF